MAQVFLSYAREDRECAEILARALTNHGWSVWWDRLIDVGGRFSTVIERELAQAKCVIVLWSRHSVQSDWVQSEASDANHREILVPVQIEEVRLPLEFRRLQTGNLCDWRKGLESPEFKACLASVEKLVRKKTLPDVPFPEPEPEPEPKPAPVWILQDGQRFCAPDPGTLRKWAKEGRVRADSQVYDPAVADWVPARELPVLRGVYPTPTPLPHPAPPRPATGIRWPLIAAVTGGIGLLLTLLLVAALNRPVPASAGNDTIASNTQSSMPTTETVTKTTDPKASTPTTPQPISVSLQNRCVDKSIVVAVCYLNNSNQWVSKGWWSIAPGQTTPNAVAAYGSWIYFFAISWADGTLWEGRDTDTFKPVMAPISLDRVNPFELRADELQGEGVIPASFAAAQLDPSQPTYLNSFLCN
ncbi:MAG TPA: toll/interleukin-1 receptor domain-containing protein [Thermoanaerobaculia bacterium]|nr:toll/interleukin-1 receptor domain-containing protein [Thermoanaerobaculia bacterium]